MRILLIILVITVVAGRVQAQCLSPLDSKSDMSPNPESDINGNFEFDYKITSSIEVKAKYENEDAVSYKTKRYVADYFVNSADGSAYFPNGFFMTNFGAVTSRQGTIKGTVWMANGQMVNYVKDSKGVLRAITVGTSQTSTDVGLGQYMFTGKFMDGIRDATSAPAPIPSDLPWGDTGGYVSEIEQEDGSTGVVTMYFVVEPDIPPIKTEMPLTGFLVGVIKDTYFHKCNRLLVYTKMEIDGGKEYIQGELFSILPEHASWDGGGYKQLTLGGGDMVNRAVDYKAQMRELHDETNRLKESKSACGDRDTVCRERYDRQIEDVKREMQTLECEMLAAMGMEDSEEECLE